MPTSSESLKIAITHYRAGRLKEAEQHYRQILSIDPKCVIAWHLMGVMAIELRQYQSAVHCLENALLLDPHSAELHYNRGLALQWLGELDRAIAAYNRALATDPSHAKARNNLGTALKDQRRPLEAIACIQQALEVNPNLAEAHCNLGIVLQSMAKWNEARPCFERAVALEPDFAEAHANLAMVLLATGDFERGWPEYEWRWKAGQQPNRHVALPRWEGQSLAGRTILLYAEQGLGDTLLFIRYAPLVKALGATVIAEVPHSLMTLLARCPGIDHLVGSDEELPPFDFYAPLLSLPAILKTTLTTVPAQVPYLFAEPALVLYWREKLRHLRGFRIGINWHGRPGQGFFRLRDVPLNIFASLAELPVSLVCLQQGATPQELSDANARSPIFHPGGDFDRTHGAFMDTAAIMQSLDLVISTCTSVPHLAGALGIPVWIALPFLASWQWMHNRDTIPWYPTARLFRQKSPGDWHGVFAEINSALREKTA